MATYTYFTCAVGRRACECIPACTPAERTKSQLGGDLGIKPHLLTRNDMEERTRTRTRAREYDLPSAPSGEARAMPFMK